MIKRVVLLKNPWYECLDWPSFLLAQGAGVGRRLAEPARYEHLPGDLILGLHASPLIKIPPEAMIYQSEHPSTWSPDYCQALHSKRIFDYSSQSSFRHLPLGYCPDFSLFEPASYTVYKDIDVLFFGSMNERRATILETLREDGYIVTEAFGVFGRGLEALISRAKLVLNIHYYTNPPCFEWARVSPLVHSRVPVLSEWSNGEGLICPQVLYASLVSSAESLLKNDDMRLTLAESGLKALKKMPMSALLKEIL